MKYVSFRIEPRVKEAIERLSTRVSLSETIRELVRKGINLQEKGEVFISTNNLSIPISEIRFGRLSTGNERISVYLSEEQYQLAKKVFQDDSYNAIRRALLVALILPGFVPDEGFSLYRDKTKEGPN